MVPRLTAARRRTRLLALEHPPARLLVPLSKNVQRKAAGSISRERYVLVEGLGVK
jgi:hypothetical protein